MISRTQGAGKAAPAIRTGMRTSKRRKTAILPVVNDRITWNDLPPEIRGHILSYTGIADQACMRMTARNQLGFEVRRHLDVQSREAHDLADAGEPALLHMYRATRDQESSWKTSILLTLLRLRSDDGQLHALMQTGIHNRALMRFVLTHAPRLMRPGRDWQQVKASFPQTAETRSYFAETDGFAASPLAQSPASCIAAASVNAEIARYATANFTDTMRSGIRPVFKRSRDPAVWLGLVERLDKHSDDAQLLQLAKATHSDAQRIILAQHVAPQSKTMAYLAGRAHSATLFATILERLPDSCEALTILAERNVKLAERRALILRHANPDSDALFKLFTTAADRHEAERIVQRCGPHSPVWYAATVPGLRAASPWLQLIDRRMVYERAGAYSAGLAGLAASASDPTERMQIYAKAAANSQTLVELAASCRDDAEWRRLLTKISLDHSVLADIAGRVSPERCNDIIARAGNDSAYLFALMASVQSEDQRLQVLAKITPLSPLVHLVSRYCNTPKLETVIVGKMQVLSKADPEFVLKMQDPDARMQLFAKGCVPRSCSIDFVRNAVHSEERVYLQSVLRPRSRELAVLAKRSTNAEERAAILARCGEDSFALRALVGTCSSNTEKQAILHSAAWARSLDVGRSMQATLERVTTSP